MTPRLRPYTAADRAACHAVFRRAVHEGAAGAYDAAQRAAWAPDKEPDAGPEGRDRLLEQWCMVAERAGRIVGFLSMTPAGHLDMAFVLPEEMGRGTAGALYDRLEAKARAAGLLRLTAHASHLARPFLARRGWQVTAPEVVERNGQQLERFAMTRDLAVERADA